MATHKLKIRPEFYQAIFAGDKTFELRKNDRDYKVGDVLILREWDSKTYRYTGEQISRIVSYVVEGGSHGLEAGWVCMGLKIRQRRRIR